LLNDYPRRRFILVGDSGERDPETYGTIARKFPARVLRIFIRDVTGEPAGTARYRHAFADLNADTWQLFQDPANLPLPPSEK
jgi:phosphatidate phosphatase APP1